MLAIGLTKQNEKIIKIDGIPYPEDSNHNERCDRNSVYIKVNIVGLSACWKIVGEFLGRISRVARIIELKGGVFNRL